MSLIMHLYLLLFFFVLCLFHICCCYTTIQLIIFYTLIQKQNSTLCVGNQTSWQSRAKFARCNHFPKSCKLASSCNLASHFAKILPILQNIFSNLAKVCNVVPILPTLQATDFAGSCKSCNFARDCKQSLQGRATKPVCQGFCLPARRVADFLQHPIIFFETCAT